MTYELKLERMIDAPPEVVFDTFIDPEAQPEIFGDQVPGWELWESKIELRVGGQWNFVFGPADRTGEPDHSESVFIEVDRPRRLSYRVSIYIGDWGRAVDLTETITFEARDGKTLVTIWLTDIETEEIRDSFMDGVPSYLEALDRVVTARKADRSS